MAEVIRRVKGQGFRKISANDTVNDTTDEKATSADKIKGIFGRKTVYVEWEDTNSGEIVYIGVRPLRPAETRLIGEQVFTEPVLNVINDENVDSQTTVEEIKKQLNLSTDAEVMKKYREMSVAVCMKVLEDKELCDEDWLMNDAEDNFLKLIHNVGVGGVTETTTVDNFQEVDSRS